MKTAVLFLSIFLISNIKAQHNLTASPWHQKVEASIALIEEYEPEIYETIKTAYIQAGQISGENEMHAWAFALNEPRYNSTIPWIMLDAKGLSNFTVKNLSAILLHEALHLVYWFKKIDGSYIYTKSAADLNTEHTYIYNYQLQYLKKIHASSDDQEFCINTMRYLGLNIYNN